MTVIVVRWIQMNPIWEYICSSRVVALHIIMIFKIKFLGYFITDYPLRVGTIETSLNENNTTQ